MEESTLSGVQFYKKQQCVQMYNHSHNQDATAPSRRNHRHAAPLWSISLYRGQPAVHPTSELIASKMPYAPVWAWLPKAGTGNPNLSTAGVRRWAQWKTEHQGPTLMIRQTTAYKRRRPCSLWPSTAGCTPWKPLPDATTLLSHFPLYYRAGRKTISSLQVTQSVVLCCVNPKD